MKPIIFFIAFIILPFNIIKSDNDKVSIETLIENIDQYEGKLVETEGQVVHICGVDQKKIKLKSEKGNIVKVVFEDTSKVFDYNIKNGKIKVIAKVGSIKIESSYVDKVEKEKTILCHIDNSPCKDIEWINAKIEDGLSDTISAIAVQRMRNELDKTENDFITVVVLYAQEIEILEE